MVASVLRVSIHCINTQQATQVLLPMHCIKFSVSSGLLEIHCTTWNHPSKPCQINAFHPSSVHMALKACSATQITDLLNYNFVGPGSVLYPRHSEISLTDRAVSMDISIIWRAMWNRQLISRGLLQQGLSQSDSRQQVPQQTFQSLLAISLKSVWTMKYCSWWMSKWQFVVMLASPLLLSQEFRSVLVFFFM